ncbi:MAG: hypothetical protein P4L42_00195 [Desulfocapsaceae bacterium]|nr:hypothetical protein [Desulfocapsaceae bacterium]
MKVIVNKEDIKFLAEDETDRMSLQNIVHRGLYSLEFENRGTAAEYLLIKLAPEYLAANQR